MQLEQALDWTRWDEGVALPMGAAILFAVALSLVTAFGRRRMPPGLGEGIIVTALSGAAVLALTTDAAGTPQQPALGHILTGLSVLWYALARISAYAHRIARERGKGGSRETAETDRRQVLTYAALVCGLIALASILTTPGALGSKGWPPGATDLSVLLLLSLTVWAFRTGPQAGYPTLTLLVLLIVVVAREQALAITGVEWRAGAFAGAILSLLLVLSTLFRQWARRRDFSASDPKRLLDPAPPNTALFASILLLCVAIGIVGILQRNAVLTPLTVVLAALSCLTMGHRRRWRIAGEIGLLLLAESLVTAAVAWIESGWSGAMFGATLSALYLLWLARFWQQQLHDGQAWTTAGSLIPVCRGLSQVATCAAFTFVVAAKTSGELAQTPTWLMAGTLVLLLLLMWLLLRDGQEHGSRTAAYAACLALASAAVVAQGLAPAMGAPDVPLHLSLAIGSVLFTLIASRQKPAFANPAALYALLGGFMPVAMLFAITLRGLSVYTAGSAAIVVLLAILASTAALKRTDPRWVSGDPT